MKKKAYITPNMIAVVLPKQPLLTPVSGFEEATSSEQKSPVNALGKGGWSWDDEPVDYEDEI